MLSGIGPRRHLERHGIPVRVDLPGVGAEPAGPLRGRRRQPDELRRVGVRSRARTFTRDDASVPASGQERARRRLHDQRRDAVGLSRGRARRAPCPTCSATRCSADSTATSPATPQLLGENPNCLTWVVLKAHTEQHAPARSRCAPPIRASRRSINFRYFDEGSDASGEDLRRRGRRRRSSSRRTGGDAEGARASSPPRSCRAAQVADEAARRVRARQRVGPPRLVHLPHRPARGRRRGDERLQGARRRGPARRRRVGVPADPGFFIVSAVYMIGEKAADVIAADAGTPAAAATAPSRA